MEKLETNEARFERLYRTHGTRIFAYALRRATPEQAADATAETFLILWRRLCEVEDEWAIGWLYGVARKVLAGQRRSQHRQEKVTARLAESSIDFEEHPAAEQTPRVIHALAELSDGDREVLMLDAWEGIPGREAAIALGCSPTAYRIRLSRARKRLAKLLARGAASQPSAQIFRHATKEIPS